MKEKRSKNLYWQRQKSAYEAAAVSISHYMCMHSVIQCTLNAVNKQLSYILKERKNVYIMPCYKTAFPSCSRDWAKTQDILFFPSFALV